ncbi:MAG: 5-methylcytosine-specific restriction endonuclease system specificity protein McrC [Anaerolineaceae bacterium]|jgi:5-methylcytosine-specific restriction enzyme subunit McrC|nr:5-methylcytosine-specific restriction endonuclease system specificity protein McrC [Anaerolineaceae bacterium]MDD4042616.1 5-methylcytosine-specific restriction endonuclease system specificity protein McrC [Anaerolineaceae bacterium]MDD4577831.1 5-methylcytosine-specific restriction endonuclease system specificity protein McrC [Anaerolineaceae bacterium]
MTEDKHILIKNIYHMLSYAFEVLRQSNYEEVASEEFENIHDLFAAILSKGIAQQLKQGLFREYTEKQENNVILRGKLNIDGTIKNVVRHQRVVACEYDEFSSNNIFNQILKTTANILIRQPTVVEQRRFDLKKLLLFFSEIDLTEPYQIRWHQLIFHRNNQTYRMLINICYFVLSDLLLSEEKGQHKLAKFLTEQSMHRLFERFVLEYYRFHHSRVNPTAPQIKWDIDDGVIDFLPTMQTDIVLHQQGKRLVIDTKYYQKSLQVHFDSTTLHSSNLYQIFTYVKNMDTFNDGSISGMLLYAKTDEHITPDNIYSMSGNRIYVKTLDLNQPFPMIQSQLDRYLTEWEQDFLM